MSLRADLVAEARVLGLSVSRSCEQGLAQAVKSERERLWLERNSAALQSNAEFLEEHGMPLERFRRY